MKNKDVIYVDVEDEITGIIDKISSSKNKLVALVLPKRATVFQSIVNMKLLKRTADSSKKRVVLVTSEAGVLPLAGAVGMHVAKTLQSEPTIPPKPSIASEDEAVDDDIKEEELDTSKPVGELAGLPTAAPVASSKVEDGAIDLSGEGDTNPVPLLGAETALDSEKLPKLKKPKNKKLKVPNFEKFRLLLIIGVVVLIALIVGGIFALKVLPKATVTIQTKTIPINSNLTVTFDSTAKTLDPVNMVVPAKLQQTQKTTASSQVPTTGSKTIGNVASGTMTITNDQDQSSHTVPDGTVFTTTDSNGDTLNFITTATGTVPPVSIPHHAPFTPTPGTSAPIPVSAANLGAQYNISSSTNYTTNDTDLSGNFTFSGSAMTGGSSQQVQAVTQQDINNAQQSINSTTNSNAVKQQLQQSLQQAGYDAITATFVAGTPSYTPSAAVNSQANNVSVTETITYTMYGVMQSDLNTLVTNSVNQQINPSTQSIIDTNTSKASFSVVNSSATTVQLTMQTSADVGPQLNATSLKSEVAGKKSGDIKSMISQTPGVSNVIVHYSPFWVTSTPTKLNKITIVIEKQNGSSS